MLTPSKDNVSQYVVPLGEDSDKDEKVEIEGLHKDPHEISTHRVPGECDEQLTLPVLQQQGTYDRIRFDKQLKWPVLQQQE